MEVVKWLWSFPCISGVEEKLAIAKEPSLRWGLKENKVALVRIGESFVVPAPLQW
jgi:hypothetical protein